jgi:hypothetical protein
MRRKALQLAMIRGEGPGFGQINSVSSDPRLIVGERGWRRGIRSDCEFQRLFAGPSA